MMVDLDDFKSLNDSRGHLAGDQALRRTGEALRSVCRVGDVAARLGGDEFALILHGCADPDATARRVLAAVRRRAGVGASIGAATAGKTSISTMQQADQSLLSAKQSGKRTFQIAS
jgi:diguanylate cyclase (GGDEF)-like protein